MYSDQLKTTKTYKTRANAVRALERYNPGGFIQYVIAVTEEGRFAPVIIGAQHVDAAFHHGITVVS